jgi:hypothetical protein
MTGASGARLQLHFASQSKGTVGRKGAPSLLGNRNPVRTRETTAQPGGGSCASL